MIAVPPLFGMMAVPPLFAQPGDSLPQRIYPATHHGTFQEGSSQELIHGLTDSSLSPLVSIIILTERCADNFQKIRCWMTKSECVLEFRMICVQFFLRRKMFHRMVFC